METWRQQAPRGQSSCDFPQQSDDRIQAVYFHVTLLLVRPAINRMAMDDDLLYRYATLAAEGCDVRDT